MKDYQPTLIKDYDHVVSTLRSNYDFYATFSGVMREHDMYSYYLPRLLQRSAKGRNSAIKELRELAQIVRDKQVGSSRCGYSVIVDRLLSYIAEAKGKSDKKLPARVLHVSSYPDPRAALHVSDSIHYDTCLATGIRNVLKELTEDESDATLTKSVRQTVSDSYMAQTVDDTRLFKDKYHITKGCNSMFLSAEVVAYNKGHIAYAVVGSPYHEDGVGYQARVRLHALYTKSPRTITNWVLDSYYGDVRYVPELLLAAKKFAEDQCGTADALLEPDSRGRSRSTPYEGPILHFCSDESYKDSLSNSDYFESDDMFVVTSGYSKSALVNTFVRKKGYLRECRKHSNMKFSYVQHIISNTATYDVSFVDHAPIVSPSQTSSFRPTKYDHGLPDKKVSLAQYVQRIGARTPRRDVRRVVIPILISLLGYPDERLVVSEPEWDSLKFHASPLSGLSRNLMVEDMCFCVRDDSHKMVCTGDDAMSFDTRYYIPSGSMDRCCGWYISVDILELGKTVHCANTYTLVYHIPDVLVGNLTPYAVKLKSFRYDSKSMYLSSSYDYYTLEQTRQDVQASRVPAHEPKLYNMSSMPD